MKYFLKVSFLRNIFVVSTFISALSLVLLFFVFPHVVSLITSNSEVEAARVLFFCQAGFSALALIFLLVLISLLIKADKNFRRKEEIEDALKKENADLVMQIHDRTEKFMEINDQLKQEISERNLEEERLRKAQQYIENLIESSIDMIISVDQDRNIVEFNSAAQKIFGYEKKEVLGKSIEMLYADPDQFVDTKALFKKRGSFNVEIMNKRKNGEVFPSLVSASVLKDRDENTIGVMGISRDISEEKRIKRELIESKEMAEEASKAKAEFLANMSHEIRTPLNGIIGMTELMMCQELDRDQSDLIQTISQEANFLNHIINNVLDFSKIEDGKLEFEKIPFDLRVLSEDMANSLAFRAEQKGLDFFSFFPPNFTPFLTGDPTRLRQVLMNLVGNSLKFTSKGEIFIKVEITEELQESVTLGFFVKDTGIGIPKEKQQLIFEKFTQADASTTRSFGGTGLGMAISRNIVELLGGEIGVESEEGKGSTFHFTLSFPRQIERERKSENKDIDITDKRVLLVEDKKISRFILSEYLKHWGCEPILSVNGQEALSILTGSSSPEGRIDLIITDLNLPLMDGFEFSREVRKNVSYNGIPILLLTSLGRIGDGKKCRSIGINGYLTQPVKLDELHNMVRSLLGLPEPGETKSSSDLVTRRLMNEVRRKSIQILLVEDYPTNQKVATKYLSTAGYEVDLAEDGQKGVAAYKLKEYDLVLMDVQMPVMDGYEATKEIRAHEMKVDAHGSSHNPTPIIAMTANAMQGDREQCLEIGMNDYISKPMKRDELLAMVEKWTSLQGQNV